MPEAGFQNNEPTLPREDGTKRQSPSISPKRVRLLDHLPELTANRLAASEEVGVSVCGNIAVGLCPSDPMLGFLQFTIGVGQLRHKVRRITLLGPAFGDIAADRSGRSPNLIGQRVHFFSGKFLRFEKDLVVEFTSFLIDPQVFEPIDLVAHDSDDPCYPPITGTNSYNTRIMV